MIYYYKIKSAVGGIADGSRAGQEYSHRDVKYIDMSDPSVMAVKYRPVADGADFDGYVKWIETDGTHTFAYTSAGSIYRRNSLGDWSNLRTVSGSVGNGLYIWNDYLYYTTNTLLGRYGPLSGTPSFTDSYQTGLTSDEYHPISSYSSLLLVGNNKYLATFDGSVWSATRLTFANDWRARDIDVWGQYVAIGCMKGSTLSAHPEGRIYLWNGTSTTFDDIVTYTGGISAIRNDNGVLYAFVGHQAELYAFTGNRPVKLKSMPKLGNNTAEVMPCAMSVWNNDMLFGIATSSSSEVPKTVFKYGSLNNDFDDALTTEYLPSHNVATGTTVKITAIRQVTPTLCLIGWDNDGDYGIDSIDMTTYHTEASLETLKLSGNNVGMKKSIERMTLITDTLIASGEYVKVYMRKNAETSWVKVGEIDETRAGESFFTINPNQNLVTDEFYDSSGYEHEFKLEWGGTGSTRPAIACLSIKINEEELSR